MSELYDVFISYGRADSKGFAKNLCQQLTANGYRVWLDLNDIPLGVNYQSQIDTDLERSHNFIFIMSPHSVNSKYCYIEVERALALHKRIIPLLHIDEINQATWQAIYPHGTEVEWQHYVAKNYHFGDVRNPRMHPALGKINWVDGRADQNNWEVSFAGLVNILERHKDYVHQHTHLLVRALGWKAQQRQSQFLLIGQDREQAEAWLKIRFQSEQPPCTPTNLHGEYITESIKNANNLMTQVFLAHAEADVDTMVKVRQWLWREGMTVWTHSEDIPTGAAFQQAIDRGIEHADNLVYLLSPDSVKSTYCRHELNHALALNKRIIPILVRPTPLADQPSALSQLQYIDLTDNQREEDYQLDKSQLLRILKTDQTYYQYHKLLLTKALKWHQQYRNPGILLRGYNLKQATTWLKTAEIRPNHPPTDLQIEFITESLRQPPAESLDVFISYSRADSDFARKLNDNLQIYGKLTWFDQESIAASSADFQAEIYHGIEASDNFLFILSPRAVNSPYCAQEVDYAAKLNKRFITVLHQPIELVDCHPELANVQWIDFNHPDRDFWDNFNQVVRVLETDRAHVQNHTKWSQRALEWQQKQRTQDLLLRGSEFAIAQAWLQEAIAQNKQPPPTKLQQAFIHSSQAAIAAEQQREKRQQQVLRALLGTVSVALIATVGTSTLAIRQSHRAAQSEIQALSQASQASFIANRNTLDALLQALEAGTRLQQQPMGIRHNPDLRAQVMTVLAQGAYWVRERDRLEDHRDYVLDVGFSPDGTILASASLDHTAKLWDQAGHVLHTLAGHTDFVSSVSISPDGETVATASLDQTAKLWSLDGQERLTLTGHQGEVRLVRFSPDGQLVATASDDGTAKLWRLSGENIVSLSGHGDRVNGVSFSPDGRTIATASYDGTVKLWTPEGDLLHTLNGHQDRVLAANFSPDGQTLATASGDRTVILWNLADNQPSLALRGHEGAVNHVQFSPDGQTIATGSADETIKLWTPDGQEILSLKGHRGPVTAVAFSPDGQTLLSASHDNSIKRWQVPLAHLIAIDRAHTAEIYGVDISPDGHKVATVSADNTAKIWSQQGNLRQTLDGHQDNVNSVRFSPDGDMIATASSDTTVKLWDHQGQELNRLIGHQAPVVGIDFNPVPENSPLIATSSWDFTAKLWHLDGTLLHTLEGHSAEVDDIRFSPDGQMVATASTDGTAKLWTIDGDLLQTFSSQDDSGIYRVRFSPDGQTIVTAGEDNTAKLWTLEGEALATLKAHGAGVWGLSFSADGQWIATSSDDNTIKLWQPDGTLITTLMGHQGPVNGLSFSPDGSKLVSADANGKLLMWDIQALSFDRLLESSCSWLSNYLAKTAQAPTDLCD
ncbi:MAG: TIR domain-containing protein [Leptolyngbya sp. LCM1.Bin17]|nr:MAG: TIR domain-containing protein [Leptolyngbya sp. LCM1.Bin17]